MFSLVMFDLDGTLLDTAPGLAAAVNAALAKSGLAAVNEEQVRCWIGNGTRQLMLRAYCHAASAPSAEASSSVAFSAALRDFEWHYAAQGGRGSEPFPGVAEGLRALRKLGVATALVTNKATRFTAALLDAHGLRSCLQTIVCGDMLAQQKPHPLPVEHCLAWFGTAPRRALLVGDSEIDVATARNAGVAVWTVSYGYHCNRLIGAARPDRVIPTIQVVHDAIAQTVSPAGLPGTT